MHLQLQAHPISPVTAGLPQGGGRGSGAPRPNGAAPQCAQIPSSALNNAYEYALPTHLALISPPPAVASVPSTDAPGRDPFFSSQADSGPGFTSTNDEAPVAIKPPLTPSTDPLHLFTMPPSMFKSFGRRTRRKLPSVLRVTASGSITDDGVRNDVLASAAVGAARTRAHLVTACATSRGGRSSMVEHDTLDAESSEAGCTVVAAPYTITTAGFEDPGSVADAEAAAFPEGARASVPRLTTERVPGLATPDRSCDETLHEAVVHSAGSIAAQSTQDSKHHGAGESEAGCPMEVCAVQASSQIADVRVEVGGKDAAVRRLKRQLDAFGEDDMFLGRWVMLGRAQRRRGGVPRPRLIVSSATVAGSRYAQAHEVGLRDQSWPRFLTQWPVHP